LIRDGDKKVIDEFSKRYFSKIRDIACTKLNKLDSEEVANDVLEALTRSIATGRYPDLRDRHGLWYLILRITQRRVIGVTRKGEAARRTQGALPLETLDETLDQYEGELDQLVADKDREFISVEIVDSWEELLRSLPDEETRQIAQLKLESHSNREIADMLQVTPSKVDRKVRLIQDEWTRIFDGGEADES
jgi:DNA-directed RNA polymerase specialized sigma24 family protein